VLGLEHRAAKASAPIALELVTQGDITRLIVRDAMADIKTPHALRTETRIIDALRSHATPLTRDELRSRLRVNNQRLGDALPKLEAEKPRSASAASPADGPPCYSPD